MTGQTGSSQAVRVPSDDRSEWGNSPRRVNKVRVLETFEGGPGQLVEALGIFSRVEMPVSTPGADLYGRTALLFLLPHDAASPALFLLSTRAAVLVTGKRGGYRLAALSVSPDALPFASGSLASVVVDLDGTSLRQRVRSRTLREVHRVLLPGGRCAIVTSSRRFPRDRREWHQYHWRRPDGRWKASLPSEDFTISAIMAARLDRQRVVELTAPAHDTPPHRNGSTADRSIMVLRRRREADGSSFLQKLMIELEASLAPARGPVRLERLLVRKIGKTTLIVRCVDERRYVVRVPRSPLAARRGLRNFAALQMLHAAPCIPSHLQTMVPRPQVTGSVDRYRYYVEDALPGTARDDYDGWPFGADWEPAALRFISEMHMATKRPTRIDRRVFDRRVAVPLLRIRRRSAAPYDSVIDRIGKTLERLLVGETLPFVWSHGDFAAANCLYDDTRRLSAVVDWELFSDRHLPLLDVLNCMEIPDERNSNPTWQRFDRLCSLWEPDRALELPPLAAYVRQMDIPVRVLPALMLMYWVDHVSKRIEGRAGDEVWMTKRVFQPLATLASIEFR